MTENNGYYLVGLGILPTKEIEKEIRTIQLELNQQYGIYQSRQPPHITIKSPYYVEDINKHSDYLSGLVRQMEPCHIVANGINHFNNQVIYLEIEMNKQLINAHNFLLENILYNLKISADPYEGINWIPHMSIAHIGDKGLLTEISYKLKKRSLEFQWKMDEIGLFNWHQQDGWSIQKVFTLV